MTREITLKQWLIEQAERESRSVSAIRERVYRGKYPDLKLRRVNSKVVFVQLQ